MSEVAVAAPLADRPLKGRVEARLAGRFERQLAIRTVGELLDHFPRTYLHVRELTRLEDLAVGELVTFVAEVVSVRRRPMQRRRGTLTEVVVTDGEDTLSLTFFHPGAAGGLKAGVRAVLSGTVTRHGGALQLVHPSYSVLRDEGSGVDVELSPIIPVYPATKDLRSELIAATVRPFVEFLGPDDVPDPLPEELRARRALPDRATALRGVHRPRVDADWRSGLARLRFEEAFVLQTGLVQRRRQARAQPAVVRRGAAGGILEEFDRRLPFDLTPGQRRVGDEIDADLASGSPMQRLLQGEVGTGKTLIALRAMLTVVDAGGQAVLLAPTEVLAAQHHRSTTALLGDLGRAGTLDGDARGTRVALLTGSLATAARRAALLDIASGAAGIVIGTHALLSDHVGFADLGLVVVDEQHRFGVGQRDALRSASAGAATVPHLLVMTATPIPRTVAMTVFGDLDVSTLVEVPAGRAEVTTHVVPVDEHPAWLGRAWTRVREEVDRGRQAFVVCPRIDDAHADDEPAPGGQPRPDADAVGEAGPGTPGAGVLATVEALHRHEATAHLRVAPLHGRLPADVKDATMRAFSAGEVDVLVATTVVEVGVDVPNASTMVVLDADRFGMSQLHQLRGRIGRGGLPGLCLLVTAAPAGSAGRQRVEAVAATRDGMELARLDLEQRREGDVLGDAQSGRRSSLRLLRVLRDGDLIEESRRAAEALLDSDPGLDSHPVLQAALAARLDEERAEYLDRA